MQGITFATAYDSLGEEGLEHSLNEPEVYGLFTNAALLNTVAGVAAKTPTVKVVIYDGNKADVKAGAIEQLEKNGSTVYHLDDFLNLGEDNPVPANLPTPDDTACIMYTSGSTGAPKGVLLSNKNIVASVAGVERLLGELLTPDATFLAYLPLAHIFELAVEMTLVSVGITMGYGQVKTLTDASVRNCVGDIRAFKPSIMIGVPAVWELIRKGIVAKITAGGKLTQTAFNVAYAAKKMFGSKSIVGHVADAVVFNKIKQATGGRLKYAVNGGAPVSHETQEFITLAVTDMIMGYGMTESTALSCILPFSMLEYGTVGVPSPAVEVKLVDFDEAGYHATNDPPQGEVLIRGATISKGYFKRDDLTKEAFTADGWLMTGDIGQWNANGTLSIIDRKKVSTAWPVGSVRPLLTRSSILRRTLSSCLVESTSRLSVSSRFTSHATLSLTSPFTPRRTPTGRWPSVARCLQSPLELWLTPPGEHAQIVFPNESNLRKLVENKGINVSSSADLDELCKNQAIKDAVLSELNALGKKAGLKPLEVRVLAGSQAERVVRSVAADVHTVRLFTPCRRFKRWFLEPRSGRPRTGWSPRRRS